MKATNSIGILREVKNKWERRVAITPSEVQKLVDRNIRVLIQPCERRVFKDLDYETAGAIITNDLSSSSFIIGVKDIPSSKLYDNHSYLNFAHVIKAQPDNMPFLDECIQKKIRLFGINTPEIRGESREKGLESKKKLIDLIKDKDIKLYSIRDKKGKYGRWLGILYVDNKNINKILVDEGYAKIVMY